MYEPLAHAERTGTVCQAANGSRIACNIVTKGVAMHLIQKNVQPSSYRAIATICAGSSRNSAADLKLLGA